LKPTGELKTFPDSLAGGKVFSLLPQ